MLYITFNSIMKHYGYAVLMPNFGAAARLTKRNMRSMSELSHSSKETITDLTSGVCPAHKVC